jgi:hypothetical protein
MVQPIPLLQDARKAERERRKRRVELESKMKRMRDEYEATISQLRILESELTDLEEAKELQRDLGNDASAIPSSQGRYKSEGAPSAAGNRARKDDTPTRLERHPWPTRSPKLIDKRNSTANETNPSKKEGKSMRHRSGEFKKNTRDPARTDESTDNGEPQEVAMRTAQLVIEMQKGMIENLVKEQLERLQPPPTARSPPNWRGTGFQRKRSHTPLRTGDTVMMGPVDS